MSSEPAPSRGVKSYILVATCFICSLTFMVLMSNVNIHHSMIQTIIQHAPNFGIQYNVTQDHGKFKPKCLDCVTEPFSESDFKSIFGNYNLPKPNCEGKLLLYECSGGLCGGLGDREKGIMSSFLLALLTDRTFVIDHRKPCDIKKFMEPNLYDWSQCLPSVGNARKKGNRLVQYIDGLGHAIPKNFTKLKPGDMWNEHVVTVHVNIRLQERIKDHPNVPTKLPWLIRTPPEVIITGLMHTLFKPEVSLTVHIQQFLDEHTQRRKRKLVAVHIRAAFLKKDRDIPIVLNFLEQYSNKDKYSLYVASDKIEVRNLAMKRFKNFITVNRTIVHIDQSNKPCDGVYTAVFEQQILSKADILVMTPSGFSRLASYIRGTSDNIYLLEIGTDKVDTHFEKIELKDLPNRYRLA